MAGRPNYRGKRLDRERKKAAKKAAKQADKVERTALRSEDPGGMMPGEAMPDDTGLDNAGPDDSGADDTRTESALDTQPRSVDSESAAE